MARHVLLSYLPSNHPKHIRRRLNLDMLSDSLIHDFDMTIDAPNTGISEVEITMTTWANTTNAIEAR
jgi:hypothetical protein